MKKEDYSTDLLKKKLEHGTATVSNVIQGILTADDQLMKAVGFKNIPMLPETWNEEYRRNITIKEEIYYAQNCDLMELIKMEAKAVGVTLGWNKHGTLFMSWGELTACIGRKRLKKYNEKSNKAKTAKDLLDWVTYYDDSPTLEQRKG